MIKVPHGNKFVLHIPLFRITDQHTKFYVNVADITDLKVKRFRPFVAKEDVESITEDIIGDDGTVTVTFSADLPLSRYSIIITGKDGARDISVNLLNCVEIVRWNEECNFTKYVLDTPLVPDLLTLPECFIAGKINWGFVGGDIEDQEDLMNLLDGGTLFASELDQLIATVQAHGDIEKGTTIADLTGMSFKQMVELILFPKVNPTITEPSLTLTFKESTFENGGTYLFDSTFPTTEDVTATFDRGLSVAGVVESPRAGEGTPVVTLSTDEWPLFGEVTISGDVAFEEGPVVKDSHLVPAEFDITGEELENPLPTGTLHQELKLYATVPFISNGFYGPNVEDNLVEAALYELSDEVLTVEKLVRVDTPEVDVEICFSSTANVQEQGIIPELYIPEHLEVVSVTMYNPLTKNYDIHDIDWAYHMNGDSPEISNIGGVNYKIVFISELLGECQLKFHMIN